MNTASLSVTEGATVTLAPADLGITDPDDTSFTFNLSGVTGGQFELTTAPGTPITGFTSAQLAANQVVFIDNGDETARASVSRSTTAMSIPIPWRPASPIRRRTMPRY